MLSALGHWMARLGSQDAIPAKRRTIRLTLDPLEDRAVPATGLGIANDFSAFVLDDANLFHSDVQGRVAVGDDATITGYAVGDQLPNSHGTRDDLIVGGDLHFTNGQVYFGNVAYGGTGYFDSFGDDTVFVPGHNAVSTFGHERKTNPFVADSVIQRS